MQKLQIRNLLRMNVNISPVSVFPFNPLPRQSLLSLFVLLSITLLVLLPEAAQASTQTGLPYEKLSAELRNFCIWGCFILSMFGIMGCVAALAFKLSFLLRPSLYLLLVAATVFAANYLLGYFLGISN